MIDDQHRSQFRIPYSLYEQLKASAEANKRSLNAEIVLRLEASFRTAGDPLSASQLKRLLDERDARMIEEIKVMVQDNLNGRAQKANA